MRAGGRERAVCDHCSIHILARDCRIGGLIRTIAQGIWGPSMITYIRTLGYAKLLLALLDMLILSGFAALILTLRSQVTNYNVDASEVAFFALSSCAAILIFREFHLYKHKVFSTRSDQVIVIGKGMLCVGILQAVTIFLIKDIHLLDYSRTHILLFVFGGWAALAAFRITLFTAVYEHLTGNPVVRRRVVAVGAGSAGQQLASRIYDSAHLGLKLVGFVDDDPQKIGHQLLGLPVMGSTDDVAEVVRRTNADEIYVTINSIKYERLLEIIDRCRHTGLPVTVTTQHFRIVPDRIGTSEFDTIESLTLRPHDLTSTNLLLKRVVDIIGSGLLLLALSPVFAAIAIAIRIDSRGPVFYKSQVIGRAGRMFTWFKFRTMRDDRDETVHREHLKKIIEGNGTTEKLRNDPRITRVGALLRRHSIDELPQLINVFRGEMSLIGPRPCLKYEYDHFDEWHKERFRVTPGMTGLWQVFGRNRTDTTFNDSIILDLYYIHNYSLWLDLKIVLKTIPVVVLGRGGA